MIYVSDTFPLIFAATNHQERLGQKARKIFASVDQGKGVIVVPMTVLEEVMLLVERKIVRLKLPFYRWVEELEKSPNFQLQPFTQEILLEAQSLSSIRDPADRIIVATARHLGYSLITGEKELRDAEWVQTVWD